MQIKIFCLRQISNPTMKTALATMSEAIPVKENGHEEG